MNAKQLTQINHVLSLRIEDLNIRAEKLDSAHVSLLSVLPEIHELQTLHKEVCEEVLTLVKSDDYYRNICETEGYISAIKAYRSDTGKGLLDTKLIIDAKIQRFGWIKKSHTT